MNLKQARLTANLAQTDVLPRLKAVEPRVDIPLLSKYENGICMPTPNQFRELCKAYHREPHEIYSTEDIDYGICKPKKDKRKTDTYRICARIPLPIIEDKEKFHTMLKQCGYSSITSWLCHCINNLEKQYVKKTKKDRPDAATSKAAQTK